MFLLLVGKESADKVIALSKMYMDRVFWSFILYYQSARRPQNLIPADVSKNVLCVHNVARVSVDWPSYNPVKESR